MMMNMHNAADVEAIMPRIDTVEDRKACRACLEALAIDGPSGAVTPTDNHNDAISKAMQLSAKGQPQAILRFSTGHFVAQFLVIPAHRWTAATENRRRDWTCAEATYALTHIQTYTDSRLSWPANSRAFTPGRVFSSFPSLTDARDYAILVSDKQRNHLITLCKSKKRNNPKPYIVVTKPESVHPSFTIIARYSCGVADINPTEELTRDAQSMRRFTAQCILPTFSVTWLDANDREHSTQIAAATETEAWNIVYETELADDGTMVSAAGTRVTEIVQLSNGTENADADLNLVNMFEEWNDERADTNAPDEPERGTTQMYVSTGQLPSLPDVEKIRPATPEAQRLSAEYRRAEEMAHSIGYAAAVKDRACDVETHAELKRAASRRANIRQHMATA